MQFFEGTATLMMEHLTGEKLVVLDCGNLRVTQVECLGEKVAFERHLNRITIQIKETQPLEIKVSYSGVLDNDSCLRKKSDSSDMGPFYHVQGGKDLFPCQDENASRFTFAASIRVPASLSVIMSADLVAHEDDQFHYEHTDPISTNQLVMAIGKIEVHNIPYGTLYVENHGQATALAYLSRWKEVIDARETKFCRERGLSVLVMPSSYPLSYAAYSGLILLNSELITDDQSQLPVLIRAIAASIIVGLNATVHEWLKEGLSSWLERTMLHRVLGSSLAQHVALMAWNKEYAYRPLDSLTGERAFAMFVRLESRLGFEIFADFMTTFVSRNTFISPGQLRSEMLAVFRDMPRIEELRSFPWAQWCSQGPIPATPHYRDTQIAAPLKMAIAWLNGQVSINGDFAEFNSMQKAYLFHILLLHHPRLTPAIIDQINEVACPFFSPDPVIRSKWLVLLARTRSYSYYSGLQDALLALNMAVHCLPVYAELLIDRVEGRILAYKTYIDHQKSLHKSVSKTIKKLIKQNRNATL